MTNSNLSSCQWRALSNQWISTSKPNQWQSWPNSGQNSTQDASANVLPEEDRKLPRTRPRTSHRYQHRRRHLVGVLSSLETSFRSSCLTKLLLNGDHHQRYCQRLQRLWLHGLPVRMRPRQRRRGPLQAHLHPRSRNRHLQRNLFVPRQRALAENKPWERNGRR